VPFWQTFSIGIGYTGDPKASLPPIYLQTIATGQKQIAGMIPCSASPMILRHFTRRACPVAQRGSTYKVIHVAGELMVDSFK
jgi:hypothetical protein